MVHNVESDKTEEQENDTVVNIITEQAVNRGLVRVARTVTLKLLL